MREQGEVNVFIFDPNSKIRYLFIDISTLFIVLR